jgi:hypothetical protein
VKIALRLCVCSVLAVLAFARPAAADWHFTPFVGWTLGGSTTLFDPENELTGRTFARGHLAWGGSVTWFGRGPVGLETLFTYVPGIFDRNDLPNGQPGPILNSRSIAVMGNLVVTIPRAWSEHGLRPFASGGFGLLHVAKEDAVLDVLSVRRNTWGYNVGGGAVGPITDRTGIRFEARFYSYVKSGDIIGFSLDREHLRFWTVTAGVVFRF